MNVLVTGATGTVGTHVVRALQTRGASVRAFVRDAGKAAQALGHDTEFAVGDFADRNSLERAMKEADRVFLACANVPGQVAYEKAAIDAAHAAGVTRIVKLSGPHAALDSPLVFERWHGEIERHLDASGLPSVRLRPSTYMTNLLAYAATISQTGMLFAPAGIAKISFVDPRDVADAAAVTLVEDGHDGNTYELTGPQAVTFDQIAEQLSAATGRSVSYVDVPDDAARQGMLDAGLPSFAVDAIVDIFRSQRASLMAQTTDTVRALTGRDARPIAEFVRDFAGAFGAGLPYSAAASS
ncbi:MAG TPA: SDR family oxidoreductase [Jatrophihabitans sp.]|nr:SDR family oxidoreductase [Jatrophihabitans sp.]